MLFRSAGYLDLKEAICYKFKRDNSLSYKPENIVVSTGAKQSLANAVLALVGEGDEVIIPTPFWVTYSELVKIARGKVVEIKTTTEQGFKMTAQQLEAAITPKTKMFLFSSPCNPSGAFYNREELNALASIFKKHPGIFILSDEIYEYINYVGHHQSIAQFAEIKDRVIVVNGLSKGFAMTGWRLGYIAAHADIAKACEKVQGQFTSGANAMTQRAAITALTSDLRPSMEMVKEFAARRKKVFELLDLLNCSFDKEQAGLFVWASIPSNYKDGYGLSDKVLHGSNVFITPGGIFGSAGNKFVRISLCATEQKIEEAIQRVKTNTD